MSQRTFLFEEHLKLGGKMVDFAGWQMPIQYKNLKQEVLAVRERIGVFDVSHMGEFFVEGPDALQFVDYLVTNDIGNAEMGKAIYSPLCREDGTIIDDLIVYKLANDNIMICVNAANIDKDFNWMKQVLEQKQYNAQLNNKSSNYSLLAVQGPQTFATLQKANLGFELQDIDYYSTQVHQNGDTPIILARTGYTGEDGFEVFGPHDYIQNIWTKLMELNVEPCGLGARDVLRLEVCYPLYGHELSDEVTPLDSTLKWTVKFDKEDFIGKKSLMEHTAKSRLVKLMLDKGIPRDNYPVVNQAGETLGIVTSGTMSVKLNKGIALARVDKNLYSDDQEIFIQIRGKNYPAKINKKPFVSGGHK